MKTGNQPLVPGRRSHARERGKGFKRYRCQLGSSLTLLQAIQLQLQVGCIVLNVGSNVNHAEVRNLTDILRMFYPILF